MKILSWNINGIRAIAKKSESNSFKRCLDGFESDIICFQETKITRELLDDTLVNVEGYDVFFSFCRVKSGYSGTATYCRTKTARPHAAEDGFTGLLSAQRAVGGAADAWDQVGGGIGCHEAVQGLGPDDLEGHTLVELDSEGRCVATDHGGFVLFNVYFPNAPSNERMDFKLAFYRAFHSRCLELLGAGRNVVVVGDFNCSARPIDHCDPDVYVREHGLDSFDAHPARRWMSRFLVPAGRFVDTFRAFHPERKDAYTCWSNVTSARVTNYGTRIDYIVVNKEIRDRVRDADIAPEVMGSDHCPCVAVLDDSLCRPAATLPRMSASNMPEFLSRQRRVKDFFAAAKHVQEDPGAVAREAGAGMEAAGAKRALSGGGGGSGRDKDRKKKRPIESFFVAGGAPSGGMAEELSGDEGFVAWQKLAHSTLGPADRARFDGAVLDLLSRAVPVDGAFARLSGIFEGYSDGGALLDGLLGVIDSLNRLTQQGKAAAGAKAEAGRSEEAPPLARQPSSSDGEATRAWKGILGGLPSPPPCRGHGLPCVLRTVKKDGPNLGKRFYVCSLPDGRKGDPAARCNHFEWLTLK